MCMEKTKSYSKQFRITIPPVASRPGRLVGSNVQLSVELCLFGYIMHHFTVHRHMILFLHGAASINRSAE